MGQFIFMPSLPKALKKVPFTYGQAKKAGLTQADLRQFQKSGMIEQVYRGVYRSTSRDFSEEDQFRSATLVVGLPSAICLVSALSQWGITDIIPKKTWILVPHEKKSLVQDLKLVRSRNPSWNIGIESREGYCITSIERTIVEAIYFRNKIGTSVAVNALRNAVNSKKTSLSKILSIAKELGVLHKILPYIEALS